MLTEVILFFHAVSVVNADWSGIKSVCSVTGDGIPIKDFVNNFSPVVPIYNKSEGSSEWVGQGS